jgi:hypothetical protein
MCLVSKLKLYVGLGNEECMPSLVPPVRRFATSPFTDDYNLLGWQQTSTFPHVAVTLFLDFAS